jgi:septum formation protein
MNDNKTIVLASSSTRRKHLLELAGINFEIITHAISETYPANLSVSEIPVFIAKQKALATKNKIQQLFPDSAHLPIVAADTVVVLNNKIIGKPQNRQDAINILTSLSGNHHQVITGVVILNEEKEISFADVTDVEFYPLTQAQIEFYVDTFQPYDKAGAYAIQEWIGAVGIKSINGSFYNVMGLPVSRLLQELEEAPLHPPNRGN